MTRDKRRRLLTLSDRLMDVIEGERLKGRSRSRIPEDLWDQLARLADLVRYEPDPPNSYREAHRWLFRLQARRLLIAGPASGRTWNGAKPGAKVWRRLGLPQPIIPWSAGWWEQAEARLDRLEARWDYAATWARRDPCRRRVAALLAAWDDYYTAQVRFQDLVSLRPRRFAA